jgi:hypothetical protein
MRRYLLPGAVSLLFIGWSPFIGLIRDRIKDTFGEAFTAVVGVALGAVVLLAVAWGVRHVREHRVRRVGLMALALLLFAGYAAVMRTGMPDVDAVERVHFVEYGLVAVLFYRAMRGATVGSAVTITLLAGTLVGIGEEWLQWLVPTRVGDVRDVLLNFAALGSGLLFAAGLHPPENGSWRVPPRARPAVLRLAGVVVLCFAGFFHCAHLGYELSDPAIGRFRSFFTKAQLGEIAADRAERWRTDPPTSLEPLAIQDHYLVEGASHVLHRNTYYSTGRFRAAWLENAILERYYDPLLDQHSMSSGALHRWPSAQRDEVEAKGAASQGGEYVSPVNMDRVYIAPTKARHWMIAGTAAALLLLAAAWLSRRARAGPPIVGGGR